MCLGSFEKDFHLSSYAYLSFEITIKATDKAWQNIFYPSLGCLAVSFLNVTVLHTEFLRVST